MFYFYTGITAHNRSYGRRRRRRRHTRRPNFCVAVWSQVSICPMCAHCLCVCASVCVNVQRRWCYVVICPHSLSVLCIHTYIHNRTCTCVAHRLPPANLQQFYRIINGSTRTRGKNSVGVGCRRLAASISLQHEKGKKTLFECAIKYITECDKCETRRRLRTCNATHIYVLRMHRNHTELLEYLILPQSAQPCAQRCKPAKRCTNAFYCIAHAIRDDSQTSSIARMHATF